MNFRHEWKHPLNSMDLQETRSRLRCVMRPDPQIRGSEPVLRQPRRQRAAGKAGRHQPAGKIPDAVL